MAKRSVEVQVLDSDLAPLLHVTYEVKMDGRGRGRGSRMQAAVAICLCLAVAGIIYLGYFCPNHECALTSGRNVAVNAWSDLLAFGNQGSPIGKPSSVSSIGVTYDEVANDSFQFDLNGHDVIVFLHIQKTGGTAFGRHLVLDLDLKRPCSCQRRRKRCNCFRPNRNEHWLFSRYSTGWRCGLHADWTELTNCVDPELDRHEGERVKRRYFYITLLREPISRYLSEFRHVQRGATWRNSRHWCGGRSASEEELPRCYTDSSWRGVTFDEFTSCEHNLAANRQTRMLADLELVGCYNTSYMPSLEERQRVLLASAKRNLVSMAWFGLTERQRESQLVFERTFNLRFLAPFEQHNATVSAATIGSLTEQQLKKIRELNALDLELYAFASQLLSDRLARLRVRDNASTPPPFDWDQLSDH